LAGRESANSYSDRIAVDSFRHELESGRGPQSIAYSTYCAFSALDGAPKKSMQEANFDSITPPIHFANAAKNGGGGLQQDGL